jgi:hypothetical protein
MEPSRQNAISQRLKLGPNEHGFPKTPLRPNSESRFLWLARCQPFLPSHMLISFSVFYGPKYSKLVAPLHNRGCACSPGEQGKAL